MDLSSLINIHDLQINIYDMIRMSCRKQKSKRKENEKMKTDSISLMSILLVNFVIFDYNTKNNEKKKNCIKFQDKLLIKSILFRQFFT